MTEKGNLLVPREVSWLSFNGRVLQEATDKSNPLIERIRFMGIFSNNLDEFFRVRVATLNRMMKLKKKPSKNILHHPGAVLEEINRIVEKQQYLFEECFNELLAELSEHKIFIINESMLNQRQSIFVQEFFNNELRPHLFPVMLSNLEDAGTLRDHSPYLAVEMARSNKTSKCSYALVEIPKAISRFVILPSVGSSKYIILLDDVIRFCLKDIFKMFSFDLFRAYTIKFTRDAELDIDQDVSKSLMELISESLKQRKAGRPIRFIYDVTIPDELLNLLKRKLNIGKNDTLIAGGRYHNFRDFISFPDIGHPSLKNILPTPLKHAYLDKHKSIFSAIAKQDVMLHFPYQSFQYINDLLREASIDPKVQSIKMTIYRVAKNSNVINSLINAARNGKRVTVVMELQARFDEKANISWAEILQEEGVKIVQSRSGFKVHAKIILIKRIENGKEMLYANIGTGNFNEDTARLYGDDSLLTSNPKITREADTIFDLMEFSFKKINLKHLILSPYSTRDFIINMLNNEIKNAKAGKDAWVIIKINNLADEEVARKIYESARTGVKIKLIVRSTCVVMPDEPGTNNNIEAISIVDKYLEHSRIMAFCNNNKEKYYITSADWMVRNFDYRIEVSCPVYCKAIQEELRQMLQLQLSDNTRARIIDSSQSNTYKKTDCRKNIRSQREIYNYLKSLNNN